jgi:hypothetical protein
MIFLLLTFSSPFLLCYLLNSSLLNSLIPPSTLTQFPFLHLLTQVDDLQTLQLSVDLIHGQQSSTKTKTPIWAMIETAKGVRNVYDIAESSDVAGIVFGQNDLSKDLRLPSSSLSENRSALSYRCERRESYRY